MRIYIDDHKAEELQNRLKDRSKPSKAKAREAMAQLLSDRKKQVRALKVLHTWATFDGGSMLDPEDVAAITAEALGMKVE